MVATLVRLRWRLTLNAIRGNTWALVGTVLGGLYGLGVLGVLASGALGLGGLASTGTAAWVLSGLGALLVAGWTVVPLLVTGVDSTLDPRALAAWTAPSRGLATGLLAAGACGVPGIITGLVSLLPALTWVVAGEPLAAGLAVVCAPAALAACVVISRLVVVSVGVSGSRRGRETTAVVAMILVLLVGMLPSLLNTVLDMEGAGLTEGLRTASRVAGLTPFGWAFAAPGLLATGSPWGAAGAAAGAWLVPVLLLRPWERVVAWVMTSSARGQGRTRAYSAGGSEVSPGSPAGTAGGLDALPDVLPWSRRLAGQLPPAAAAVAARCLRYWRTDPRYLVQVISLLVLPVFLVVIPTVGTSHARVGGEGQTASLVLGQGPSVLLLIVPVLALLMGWALNDDLGTDSTALWSHISAGVPGWQDMLGRVVAALVWQLPVMIASTVGACLWTGRWDVAPALVGASTALLGCALAWSCLTCVLMPYETYAPGDSPMVSRTSGTVFVAALVQMLGMLIILLAAAPAVGAALLTVAFGRAAWGWGVLVLGIVWAGGVLVAGVRAAGTQLDRRGPDVLATIRSWPRHSQEV